MKSRTRLLAAALLLGAALLPTVIAGPRDLVLATTTSTQDTGLLDALVPRFERQTGLRVKVIAVGTGQALELGRRGDADVLLVHAPEAERRFVAAGHGTGRKPVFYNDFVLVGPAGDPAGVGGAPSAAAALARIARKQAPFVSRGDDSGTHQKEQALWKQAGLRPSGRWYLAAGAGMSEALRIADERGAYTLSDRGTYLALLKTLRLRILFQGKAELRNPYAVMGVNPGRHPRVNSAGARRFTAFLVLPETRRLIAAFGRERYGEPLFYVWPSSGK